MQKSLKPSLEKEIEDILYRHLRCEDDDECDCDCDCVIIGYSIAIYSIMEAIEKRIDELKSKHPADLYRAYNAGLDDIKEILK